MSWDRMALQTCVSAWVAFNGISVQVQPFAVWPEHRDRLVGAVERDALGPEGQQAVLADNVMVLRRR